MADNATGMKQPVSKDTKGYHYIRKEMFTFLEITINFIINFFQEKNDQQ